MKFKTMYLVNPQKHTRLESTIKLSASVYDVWYACKKDNGLWVIAHAHVEHQCPCCESQSFCIRYTSAFDRNQKGMRCDRCGHAIWFDSYEVPTPDQAVGVWRKVDGKWCVKIISGTVGEEVVVLSKKGNSIKKAKKLTFVK